MAERLHVVLGKGGVGKSTVAAALALSHHDAGARVLCIELDTPGGASRTLGANSTTPGEIVGTHSGVAVTTIDGAAALAEYLRRKVHLGGLARVVFEHPLYAAFVQAAPGVKELLAIGKVRDELLLQKRWDVVVVDAGASGHALEHLRMPGAAAATFRRGRVHREASRVHGVLADPKTTSIHVVATAEEMPVLEAIESARRIRDDLGLPLGRVIVNRCLPPAPAGVDRALSRVIESGNPSRGALAASARRALGWERIQERGIARLERALGLDALRLPRWVVDGVGAAQLRTLGRLLFEGTA